MGAQHLPGRRLVPPELRDERVEPVELDRLAQPSHEIEANSRPVEIGAHIEEVRLERDGLVAERRSRTEVHHPARRSARGLNDHGVYPRWWEKLLRAGMLDVDRRKAKQPSPLLPVDHPARRGVATAEPTPRRGEIARRHGAPDAARSN